MADSPHRRLMYLLLSFFDSAEAFRIYCARDALTAGYLQSLSTGASGVDFFEDIIEFFDRNPTGVNSFLERLSELVPERAGEIRVVAQEWRAGMMPLSGWLGVTRGAPSRFPEVREEIFLNVWFPAYEPREPRLVIDQPIDMNVDLGPQRLAAKRSNTPLDPATREALLGVPRVDVWVQCADASVTPCDGTLVLPWPTNVLTFVVTPRMVGSMRIGVVLLVRNQPIHRLQRELQVLGRHARAG